MQDLTNLPLGQNAFKSVFDFGLALLEKGCLVNAAKLRRIFKEKRHYIGFELNKDYFDKAYRRISAEKRQLTLF